MPEYVYHLVDVFTETRFGGNQLAVFPNAEGLSTELMQHIAKELNLSETTFVLPPKDTANHARVRIFTPTVEMPTAGHPTVGTAFVLQREGMIPLRGRVRFEQQVGVIPVDLEYDESGKLLIHMTQPLPQFGASFADRRAVADMLSLTETDLLADYPLQVVSSGVPFLYIPIKSLDAIRQIRLRLDLWEQHLKNFDTSHVFVFTPETKRSNSTVHSRMFAPTLGIVEDPATGIACGPLGAYLVTYGLASADHTIISEQGFEINRPSIVYINVTVEDETITGVRVGGSSVYVGRGRLYLD